MTIQIFVENITTFSIAETANKSIPENVPEFHEKYFYFPSSSNKANGYYLKRCVIFKLINTIKPMDTTWTHETRCTYAQLVKNFPFWVTVKFPKFPLIFVFSPRISEFSLTAKMETTSGLS